MGNRNQLASLGELEFNLKRLLYYLGFEVKVLFKNCSEFSCLLQQSLILMLMGVWIGKNLVKIGCSWMRSSASSHSYVQLRSRLWAGPRSMLCVIYLPWLEATQDTFSSRIAGMQGPGKILQEYLKDKSHSLATGHSKSHN